MSLIKKYLTEMSVIDDEVFVLNPREAEKMDSLFKDLGVNLDVLRVDDINEGRTSISGMKPTDRFDKNWAIKIKRGTHTRLREMIDEGLKSKDWYYDIANVVYNSLGESEGCLFLLLLASTSPLNMLTTNFTEASIIYKGFKEDIEDNEILLLRFLNDTTSANEFGYDEGSEFGDLNFVKAMSNYGIGNVSAKINNIRKSMKYYYEADGNLKRTEVVSFLGSKFNPYSKTVKGIVDITDGDVLQKSKVYNFAVNLIDPEYYVNIQNKKWYFVTIDTWMIRAMYPYLPDDEKQKVISHNAKYLYAQEKIMDFSKEVNLEPHQVQASIWTAKLLEDDRQVDKFEVAITNKIRDLKKTNRQFDIVYNAIKEVIDEIYSHYSVKPERQMSDTARYLDDEVEW